MKQSLRKIVVTSVIGNALEFYDFTICGVLIATLSQVFFPNSNPTLSLFASFFAFSAAFWTRPFGAYVFGSIGDRFGRKKALTISVILMGLPTFFIGILPGYETLGILSPVILILCRMVQGVCTGGEYNGAAIFALEHAANKRPGFISGFISASCVMGAIVATIAGAIVSQPHMPSWAWRVPFLFGAFISLIGYYVRRQCHETPEYLASSRTSSYVQPLLLVFKEYKIPFLVNLLAGGMNGILSYTLFAFLNIYLSRYIHIPLEKGIFMNIFGLMAFMFLCPVFGALSDKKTARDSIFLSLVGVIILSPISFSLLQAQETILLGQILLGALVASFVGPSHAFMQTLFPVKTRYTGISMSFCIGMAITGGTTPMLLTYLIDLTENLYIPAMWLVVYAIILFSVLYGTNEQLENQEKQETNDTKAA
jgi:MHS family proline/betaine transporter-like MFS transporter